jgi:GNAT superfamily N-acetyltransferase
MVSDRSADSVVRDVRETDIPALITIKGPGSEAVHRDRLREAQGTGFRYLVLVAEDAVIGFACLVLRRPASWSDANDTQHLPQIVDLHVHEARQGQGHGSAFVHAIEQVATTAGARHLYLTVEPQHNPRAFVLYQRLGYQPLQEAPYPKRWAFIDSAGMRHQGENWVVDMVKSLSDRV